MNKSADVCSEDRIFAGTPCVERELTTPMCGEDNEKSVG